MGSQEGLMVKQPWEDETRSWFRDGYYLTTDKSILDPKTVNDIFASDLMWWNKPMDISAAKTMLDNSLTFAIYAVPDLEEDMRRE